MAAKDIRWSTGGRGNENAETMLGDVSQRQDGHEGGDGPIHTTERRVEEQAKGDGRKRRTATTTKAVVMTMLMLMLMMDKIQVNRTLAR